MLFRTAITAAMALGLTVGAAPATAQEQASQEEGTVGGTVVAPSRVSKLADLRFGAFAAPDTASTIRVRTDGGIQATGAVAATMNVPQPAGGRGPAQFRIEQDGRLFFNVYYPRTIQISNGSASMTVNNTTARLVRTSTSGLLGLGSIWRLDMGGTLNVNANQAAGRYSGDFVITVTYL
ncbi:DUF4402 domain-containing protein [Qipengyuania sp. JC766]|uniref:DUF4402 domain-containing protein n=1 Tax=Qipengyuania sp. JC766 TaxID=3232139 RepID=UPI0034592FFF